MATTTKRNTTTTSKKTATAKAEPVVKEVDEVSSDNVVVEEIVNDKIVEFGEEDLILCRAIIPGETILIGKKSENRYSWDGIGDTCEVEARDLNSLRASKSPYLYRPIIVIENEDFVNQPKWKELKNMYDDMIDKDFDEIINLPLNKFKEVLVNLKEGYRKALTVKLTDLIEEGTFDSMNKIKAVDEIFGTDLLIMIK